MAKATVFFYDENKERNRRKRFRGDEITHEIKEEFVEIKVDGSTFVIKRKHVISVDITE